MTSKKHPYDCKGTLLPRGFFLTTVLAYIFQLSMPKAVHLLVNFMAKERNLCSDVKES